MYLTLYAYVISNIQPWDSRLKHTCITSLITHWYTFLSGAGEYYDVHYESIIWYLITILFRFEWESGPVIAGFPVLPCSIAKIYFSNSSAWCKFKSNTNKSKSAVVSYFLSLLIYIRINSRQLAHFIQHQCNIYCICNMCDSKYMHFYTM